MSFQSPHPPRSSLYNNIYDHPPPYSNLRFADPSQAPQVAAVLPPHSSRPPPRLNSYSRPLPNAIDGPSSSISYSPIVPSLLPSRTASLDAIPDVDWVTGGPTRAHLPPLRDHHPTPLSNLASSASTPRTDSGLSASPASYPTYIDPSRQTSIEYPSPPSTRPSVNVGHSKFIMASGGPERPAAVPGYDTITSPDTQGQHARMKGPGTARPTYVSSLLDRASANEHSHHHPQNPPPMIAYSYTHEIHSVHPPQDEGIVFGSLGLSPPSLAASNNNNTSSTPPAPPIYYASHESPLPLDEYPSRPSLFSHIPPTERYPHRPSIPVSEHPAPYTIPAPLPNRSTMDEAVRYTAPTVPTNSPNVPSPPSQHSPVHSQSPERPSPVVTRRSLTRSDTNDTQSSSPGDAGNQASDPVVVTRNSSDEPSDELNLIGDAAGPVKEPSKPTVFECPGCDLTFTRLSALKQHMLSHTGEKPHACDHCGRRFSLASNLRRHTSTKACKVLKFQEVKENVAGGGGSGLAPAAVLRVSAPSPTAPICASPPATSVSGTVTSSPTVLGPVSPVAPTVAQTAVKKDKKRKAPAEKPTPRRKRHVGPEARWIPRTLALFKNAHLLTSTPPFQFCMYRSPKHPPSPDSDEMEDEPFTRPTLPLHPVRPTSTSRASIRSVASGSSSSASSSWGDNGNNSDGGGFDDDEERDSYEEAPEFPYHPASWHGRLPGPGLLAGDELVKNPSVARRWMSFKR
ncbi:Zinc finger and BTB domain-containing protein 8A [Tulasnella sp. 403]|nr:Zinc finger and BTB domain-containing protein 8A [Tulasnella sp. 403]